MNSEINWNDVIKKEARGINNEDFGEVQDIQDQYVLVQKGIFNKERFYIPKDLAESYDGYVLRFRFSERELSQYYEDPLARRDSNSMQDTAREKEAIEEHITLTEEEERLDISKKSQENQATITKKPVTETKTVEVSLTREKISIERWPPSGLIQAQSPIQSKTEIKIPLKREEVKVTKKPYVKEEVIIKKNAFTDSKEITGDVTS
jgi:uncharacterized protein (TIGR02271 family)